MHLPATTPEAIQYLRQSDPVLARLIDAAPAPVHDSSGDVYYDLLSCVVDQQIHYRTPKSGGFARLLALFPGGYPHPAQLLQLPEDEVLAIKISGQKYRTICALATQWLDKDWAQTDWLNLPDALVRERLGSLPGIGRWTIDMILLFTIQRPDVFPVDDYQLKKTVPTLYELADNQPLVKMLQEIARRWSPYRSTACQYIWAYASLPAKTRLLPAIP